jgi:hypothetical protein
VNLLVLVLLVLLVWGRTPLSEQKNKLQLGMSLAEVEKVLGRSQMHKFRELSIITRFPPSVYPSFGPYQIRWRSPVTAEFISFIFPKSTFPHSSLMHFWIEPQQCLLVLLDSEGKVEHLSLRALTTSRVSWSEWLNYQYEYWATGR